MILAPLPLLAQAPERACWFRAVSLQYLDKALSSLHTKTISSRFSSASYFNRSYEVVYFARTPELALFEAGSMLGSPFSKGASFPDLSFALLSVHVQLQRVADLTNVPASQIPLGTSAQELTGDWMGYSTRAWNTHVKQPIGFAPTQLLGEALFRSGLYEGFRTPSSKIPHEEVLGVFPECFIPGSFVEYTYPDAAGTPRQHRIP